MTPDQEKVAKDSFRNPWFVNPWSVGGAAGAIERVATIAILLLGAFHGFLAKDAVNADGVSYIDIADNWLRTGKAAANGYFSPLYSWVLMAPLALHPSAEWEGPLVHAVNFLLLVLALLAFRFFSRELQQTCPPVSQPAFTAVAYSLFAGGSLRMVTVAMVAPDMMYAAVILLLCGLLLRWFNQPVQITCVQAVHLGLVWGVGYLCRAAILPIVAISALAALFAWGGFKRGLPKIIVAGVVAACVAAPWVAVLSAQKGHFTLGSAGSLNYAWLVNRKPFQHARESAMPHPTRLVFEHPAIYEFAAPIAGTYPAWTDPSYWNEGLAMKIDLKAHTIYLVKNLIKLGEHLSEIGGVLAALAVLFFWRRSAAAPLPWNVPRGVLWLLALSIAGLSVYLALNVEARYFASFWMVLWLCLWAAIPLPSDAATRRVLNAAAAGVVFTIALGLAHFLAQEISLHSYATRDLRTAQEFGEAGVPANSAIATVAVDNDIFWARLARLRVIAEIPTGDSFAFWSATPERRQEILNTLRSAGAGYVVAGQAPPQADEAWRAIGPRPLYLLQLH